MEKPYIISEELDLLSVNSVIAAERKTINSFRESLDDDLRKRGKNTVWINSNELQQEMANILKETRLPVVSLDDRYITTADKFIGISRGVDTALNDCGYVPRVGYEDIEVQLDALSYLGKEVVIADDVVFGGDMIVMLDEKLKERNIKIASVVCGIAIRGGLERLSAMGIDVRAVRVFDDIDDEICERDFAVVRGSGRRIKQLGASALYFDPQYGRPEQWASLPREDISEFALNSYERSALLLPKGIELSVVGKFYGLEDGPAQFALRRAAARIERELP